VDAPNDWDAPQNFEFAFDMALAPQVKLGLPPSHTFEAYEIKVEESAIDEEVDKLARRFGNYTSPEITDVDCSVYGTFEQLGSDGNPVEGGVNNRAFMTLIKIRDEAARQKFMGASTGAQVVFNPMAAIGSDEEVRYLLGIRTGGLEAANSDFRFTLERVNKVEKAAIDQGLFDQVYGEGSVADEAAFRQRIHDEIAQGYRYEAENALQHEIEDVLLKEAALSLPDEFLRRWLKHSNEKITDEQLEKEYHQYARDLQLRLIENTIYAEQNMEISKEEIESYARNMIIDQYLRYGQAHMLTEDKLGELVQRYLSNQESVQRVVENLSRRKVFEYLSGIVNKNVKSVTHNEFTDLMSRHHHHH
jgi:trigger factor